MVSCSHLHLPDDPVDGGLELPVLDPGAAGAREVLGHLQPLGVLQDLPGQEVPVLAGIRVPGKSGIIRVISNYR